MAGIPGFNEVPTLPLQILVIISAIIQTVLFIYHFCVNEAKLKSKPWLDILATILCIFFIVSIVITSIGYEWCIIDLTIDSFKDINLQYLIYYIGTFMLLLGNGLFIWLEMHLKKGHQSPWYNNDIALNKIDVNIVNLTVAGDSNNDDNDDNIDDNNKILVTTGPFKHCRHPIIMIMLCWEFGYGLATGAWFEFIAFISFVSVELFHISTIEKSLLLKYGDAYYQYMQNKNAFFPGFVGRYLCEMGVYTNSCVCLCLFNQNLRHIDQKEEVLLN